MFAQHYNGDGHDQQAANKESCQSEQVPTTPSGASQMHRCIHTISSFLSKVFLSSAPPQTSKVGRQRARLENTVDFQHGSHMEKSQVAPGQRSAKVGKIGKCLM